MVMIQLEMKWRKVRAWVHRQTKVKKQAKIDHHQKMISFHQMKIRGRRPEMIKTKKIDQRLHDQKKRSIHKNLPKTLKASKVSNFKIKK